MPKPNDRKMHGPLRTYRLGEDGYILRNTESINPQMDGWWLDVMDTPAVKIGPRTALLLLRTYRHWRLLERL